MPNISEIIGLTSAASGSGLAVADNELIKGAFQVFSTLARLQAAPTARLTDGQIVWVAGESKLYQLTITLANPPITFVDTYTWNEFTGFGGGSVPSGTISGSLQIAELGYLTSASAAALGFGSGGGAVTDISALNTFTASAQTSLSALNSATSSYALKTEISGAFTSVSSSISTRLTSLEAGGGSVPAGTISGSQQITDLGFINQSQTSSMSVATASYVDPTFISASAAAAGFGSGGGTTTDISALNTFTSSIQTQVDNLTAETSSYLTSADTSSFILASQTSSMSVLSALTASYLIGGAGSIDTSSFVTNDQTSSFIAVSQTSSMSVLSAETASFISDTFISASAARSGFGTSTLPSGVVSSSAQTIANLQGTGILSGSSSVPAGTISGSQQITDLGFINQSQTSSMSVATASYVSPTFISASAAAAGFGSGGGTIPAGTVSSSAQTVANLVGQDVVVNSITAETYIISSSVSFITTSFSSGSTAFGDTLSDTHTFTGSVSITGSLNIGGPFTVNNENLNVSNGSIILTNSSSIVVLDSGIISGTFVGNLNYDYITNLPNLISSSTQIALLGAGILSASAQIASDISGAFTSLSSSFASRIAALEAGSGGGSGIFTLTGSFYSTTNNLQITGSLSVGSGSFKSFEVDSDGFVVLGDMDKDLSNAPVGTIAYSGSDFYLIS